MENRTKDGHWNSINIDQEVTPISGTLYRLVESQEQVATLGYVDTLEEQVLLEAMLDEAKPSYPDNMAQYSELDYLLKTPFRYPPLDWGSRFGRVQEPSLFYGGSTIPVTLTEAAFYRFVFWFSMQAEPPKSQLRTQHTLFSARYASPCGLKLNQAPFSRFENILIDPSDYTQSQQLGKMMRDAGVKVFHYASARDPQKQTCIGLFSPEPFMDSKPLEKNHWFCELTSTQVSFKHKGDSDIHTFLLEDFLIEGELPLPA